MITFNKMKHLYCIILLTWPFKTYAFTHGAALRHAGKSGCNLHIMLPLTGFLFGLVYLIYRITTRRMSEMDRHDIESKALVATAIIALIASYIFADYHHLFDTPCQKKDFIAFYRSLL